MSNLLTFVLSQYTCCCQTIQSRETKKNYFSLRLWRHQRLHSQRPRETYAREDSHCTRIVSTIGKRTFLATKTHHFMAKEFKIRGGVEANLLDKSAKKASLRSNEAFYVNFHYRRSSPSRGRENRVAGQWLSGPTVNLQLLCVLAITNHTRNVCLFLEYY